MMNIVVSASERTMSLIETAVSVQNLGWEWLWIADSLYRTAIWIAKEIEAKDKQIISTLRYVYARFLFYECQRNSASREINLRTNFYEN